MEFPYHDGRWCLWKRKRIRLLRKKNKTAAYKIIEKDGGRCYRFFCEASGMMMVTTKPYRCDNPEEELEKAWSEEGKEHFNLCHKCGRWVCDAMYNSTVDGYTSVIPETTNVQLQNGKAKYALYPVWILNTTWNGQKYTFAMNGQTGKLVGDLPMDKGAYNKYLFMVTAIGAAAAFAVQHLFWML